MTPEEQEASWETDEHGVNAHGEFVWHVDDSDPNAVTPPVWSRWTWEPDIPAVRARVIVTGVVWNGDEWWVQLHDRDNPTGPPMPNSLGRFWEACEPDPPERPGFAL